MRAMLLSKAAKSRVASSRKRLMFSSALWWAAELVESSEGASPSAGGVGRRL